jgi:hypothetical protein
MHAVFLSLIWPEFSHPLSQILIALPSTLKVDRVLLGSGKCYCLCRAFWFQRRVAIRVPTSFSMYSLMKM